jgi:glycerol kinase
MVLSQPQSHDTVPLIPRFKGIASQYWEDTADGLIWIDKN